MADHTPIEGKLPPVSNKRHLSDDGLPHHVPKDNASRNVPISPKIKQDARNPLAVERRYRRHKSTSDTCTTTVPPSAISEPTRGLVGRDTYDISNTIASSRTQQARNTPHRMRFTSLPLSLSVASDYNISVVDRGLEECPSNSVSAEASILAPQLSQPKRKGLEDETKSAENQASGLGMPIYTEALPPVPDLRSLGKRRFSDMTVQGLYEMQRRYKNLMQLSKHVQFSNSHVLKGERILRKPNSLPGIKPQTDMSGYDAAVNKDLELLAILSVKQGNESDLSTSPVVHNSVTLGLAKKWSNNSYASTSGNYDQTTHRERMYENRKRLNKKDAINARRKRREALKEDSERMLITKAIEMGNPKDNKSFCFSWAGPSSSGLDQRHICPDPLSPKATVTVSGEAPVRKSIEITLPDCSAGVSAENDSEKDSSDVLSPQSFGTDTYQDFPDILLGLDESLGQSDDRDANSSVLSEETTKEDHPLEHKSPDDSLPVYVGDFLGVPVSNITRSFDVLSLGRTGGSSGMDIPEIRMISATPLPPGSPE